MKIAILVMTAFMLICFSVNELAKAELLFHYNFESKDLEDASGNNNLGEVRGDPVRVRGKVGMALKFDGEDDCIFTAGHSIGPLTFLHDAFTEKSMAMWVKADDVNGDYTIFDEGGEAKAYGIRINVASLQLSTSHDSNKASAIADYEDTDWHHIAGVFSKGELRLYIDGKEVASGEAPYKEVGGHTNAGAIGATFELDVWGHSKGTVGGNFFKGVMDEIRYYNNALTADEIMSLYQLGSAVEPFSKLTTTWAKIKSKQHL